MFPQLDLHIFNRTACVDRDEGEFIGEAPVFIDQPALIPLERIEQIGPQRQMHSRFPIVHSLAHDDARNQSLDVDIEVEDEVRHQRHPKQLARPIRIGAHHAVARERRVHVTVGDHDEAGLQRGQDLMLETIGEVRGVEKRERRDGQLMPGLGLVDGLREQGRARPSGVTDRVAFEFEPRPDQLNLRGAADAIGPFDCDQMTRQPLLREVRQPVPVPVFSADVT